MHRRSPVRGAGGATRRHAARAVLFVLALGATGCATKGDIRDVREDLGRLEERQDSIFRLLQMQNREILDSLTVTTERLLNIRGELANELTQLRDQLVQVGELTGQVQIRLNQFDQELATALREIAAGGATPVDTAGPGAQRPGAGLVTDAYEAGLEQLDRGNSATARRAFRMVVDSFPEHPIAPEAQRQIGETYAVEGLFDEALEAFEAVVERYQNSDAAPRALYRAGVIARERGQLDRAREYFRRLISAYPDSDASRAAEQALERIGSGP